jgi:hypothetical protein
MFLPSRLPAGGCAGRQPGDDYNTFVSASRRKRVTNELQ